jgi:peptidase MA superfamily protein
MSRRSPLARFFARIVLAVLGLLLASGLGRSAWAEDAAAGLVPRDVSVVVQPDAARLPAAPPDFERIDHRWLVLEEPASIHDRSDALLKAADDFRARLSQDFGQPALEKVIVRIAREPDQMAELAPAGAPPFTYAAGMAYPSLRVILLTLKVPDTWDAPDLQEVLGHELSHMALAEAVASHHVPLWFDEGLAIHESGELPYARMKTLWDATMSGRLLPLEYLDQRFPSDRYEVNEAYAEAADFVRFLMREADRARFVSMLQRVRAGVPFDRTLEDAYGSDTRKLEYEWHGELSRHYGIIPLLTGGGLIWVLIAGLATAAWLKRRRRARVKLAEWAREEAEMDAIVAARRAAAASVPPPEDDMPARPPSIPVVEHDGRWHTLH